LLAECADAERGERDAELHRGDETRRVAGDPKDIPSASVALMVQLDDPSAARRHQAVFGSDEEGVQQNQNADGDQLEQKSHGPPPGPLVLGGISSSNYAAV